MRKERVGFGIFENTADFIKDTLDMLDKVGQANPQGDHPADQNISVLIVKAAILNGRVPKGCPADYDLNRFQELVELENALRITGAKL